MPWLTSGSLTRTVLQARKNGATTTVLRTVEGLLRPKGTLLVVIGTSEAGCAFRASNDRRP